ncbi:M28 family peptidase [Gemmatimonas groenlandica]|uniref:Vacuolar membrane protease n=1 Tax=Gemmatimonas groenlandica TaxID=2732249 RepID=A0A6M4IVC9_9BACT|nr:M28 family peptidase [Gemmatimonas groenlandica]QJR36772.1 M28 family peptidase [Gemmatimonas groenlandica]
MTRSAPLRTLAALVLLVGALIVRSGLTPAPLPETAPAGEFSSSRALRHVRAIAERPHPSGSADHARVREYIMAELRTLGLEPQVQEATGVGTRYPAAGHVKNIVVRVRGRVAGGKAVLIAAHYDGVGAAPAAGDDGSGSAALLETLRALRAGAPLEHDVTALFTDAEESGLLGAAAFVREHPWARDVALTMNFEARGTTGRSLMFETGAGNLDVARVLATLNDVTASSLSVTIYRSLPNDTDLSELSLLGTPALNFAFVDGVERYHTFHDDVAHLDAGSLQHHGTQLLALTKTFGSGPLPRPVTSDAILFNSPFVGVLAYPESYSVPIALVVAAAVIGLAVFTARSDKKWARGMLLGAVAMLVATALGGLASSQLATTIEKVHTATTWDGQPSWSGAYALALAMLALAIAAGAWALARRWATRDALHVGALVVWVGIACFTAVKLPVGELSVRVARARGRACRCGRDGDARQRGCDCRTLGSHGDRGIVPGAGVHHGCRLHTAAGRTRRHWCRRARAAAGVVVGAATRVAWGRASLAIGWAYCGGVTGTRCGGSDDSASR